MSMKWLMIWSLNFVIHQIPFETEALCEEAKAELVRDHTQKVEQIACVQVTN